MTWKVSLKTLTKNNNTKRKKKQFARNSKNYSDKLLPPPAMIKVHKSLSLSDKAIYLGTCERGCPRIIPSRNLQLKLVATIKYVYSYYGKTSKRLCKTYLRPSVKLYQKVTKIKSQHLPTRGEEKRLLIPRAYQKSASKKRPNNNK